MNRDQWQAIIKQYHQSKLSKRAFAEQHDLVYSQLLYWIRQFDNSQTDSSDKFRPENLVPLTIKPAIATSFTESALGTIEFPNGALLKIHSTELLTLLPELLGVQ